MDAAQLEQIERAISSLEEEIGSLTDSPEQYQEAMRIIADRICPPIDDGHQQEEMDPE